MILAATSGTITANTPIELTEPMTGASAKLPIGACIYGVFIYRDGNLPVSDNCTITLGTNLDASRFIAPGDAVSTTDLNLSQAMFKMQVMDKAHAEESTITASFSSNMTLGAIYFQFKYIDVARSI